MCWRDDVVMHRWCSMCGQRYYGDLGHRYCPKRHEADELRKAIEADKAEQRWTDDGGNTAGVTPSEGQQ